MIVSKALELADAFGYLTQHEVMVLQVMAASIQNPYPLIVNFGSGSGTSGLAFREGRRNAHIVTIDQSQGGPEGGLDNEINAFVNAGMGNLIPTQYLSDSAKFGQEWDENMYSKVDIVFVDGDHSAAGLQRDIDAWAPHVVPGGYMIFHDYGSHNWPDVKALVDKLPYEVVMTVDTIRVVRMSDK